MPNIDTSTTASILLDVENMHGDRYTIFKIVYPSIILAELNTHRMLSRSSASSRAIPTKKKINKVEKNPFIPSWIGKNQSGMKAREELDEISKESFRIQWKLGAQVAASLAGTLNRIGVHKQIANRVLQPWEYTTTIVAATNWNNFFRLRAHPDAQPEFMILAYRMLEGYLLSEPTKLEDPGWIGPFWDRMPPGCTEEDKKKISTARAARISYDNFDGEIKYEDDIRLHDDLLASKHMSPFEFVVRPSNIKNYVCGNLKGFTQYRKTILEECGSVADLKSIYKTKPSWV